jgi:hypothetical protein
MLKEVKNLEQETKKFFDKGNKNHTVLRYIKGDDGFLYGILYEEKRRLKIDLNKKENSDLQNCKDSLSEMLVICEAKETDKSYLPLIIDEDLKVVDLPKDLKNKTLLYNAN